MTIRHYSYNIYSRQYGHVFVRLILDNHPGGLLCTTLSTSLSLIFSFHLTLVYSLIVEKDLKGLSADASVHRPSVIPTKAQSPHFYSLQSLISLTLMRQSIPGYARGRRPIRAERQRNLRAVFPGHLYTRQTHHRTAYLCLLCKAKGKQKENSNVNRALPCTWSSSKKQNYCQWPYNIFVLLSWLRSLFFLHPLFLFWYARWNFRRRFRQYILCIFLCRFLASVPFGAYDAFFDGRGADDNVGNAWKLWSGEFARWLDRRRIP